MKMVTKLIDYHYALSGAYLGARYGQNLHDVDSHAEHGLIAVAKIFDFPAPCATHFKGYAMSAWIHNYPYLMLLGHEIG
jgi:hypothetical protein